MTNEEILELAKICGFDYHEKWRLKGGKSDNQIHWECWEDQLLKFAKAMCDKGYNQGYYEGYKSGSTGVFGEPLG